MAAAVWFCSALLAAGSQVDALHKTAPLFVRADAAPLRDELQRIIDKHSSFWNVSMSFAIHNDTLELAVASGHNNYADPTSMLTPNHSIPMGSVTKFFTAVGLLRLAENGTISLDQPVAPLVDRYLAQKKPCASKPSYCTATCVPIAHCLKQQDASCLNLTKATLANCSYCVQYLHCDCNATTACPPVATLRGLWDGLEAIESVTFRMLLSMASGVKDYYMDPSDKRGWDWLATEILSSTRDVEPLEYLVHQDHEFLFAPMPPPFRRGAYSTNGFSLVGLALAGLFGLDWPEIDQAALAWGPHRFADDQTLFPRSAVKLIRLLHCPLFGAPHYRYLLCLPRRSHSCWLALLGSVFVSMFWQAGAVPR
jgi:CubicO group peptidase (beta-lactamase class C family)